MDQINLSAWIDRSDTLYGGVSYQKAKQVHSVLGRPGTDTPEPGSPLPALWHWYAFPPAVGMNELGEDGHPRLGDFMPPIRLNRRMWAGGSLEFHAPLHVGDTLKKRTRIASVTEKTGAAGDIVLVSLDHEIHGPYGLAVSERQDIVYLQIPESYTPPKKKAAPEAPDIRQEVAVSTPLLFRYSAVTFNAHRIHYDLPYTQEVEHYPDLVVHGPLQAQLLMDMATRERGSTPRMFSYRGIHPLFAADALTLTAVKKETSDWALATVANDSHQTMTASALWEV